MQRQRGSSSHARKNFPAVVQRPKLLTTSLGEAPGAVNSADGARWHASPLWSASSYRRHRHGLPQCHRVKAIVKVSQRFPNTPTSLGLCRLPRRMRTPASSATRGWATLFQLFAPQQLRAPDVGRPARTDDGDHQVDRLFGFWCSPAMSARKSSSFSTSRGRRDDTDVICIVAPGVDSARVNGSLTGGAVEDDGFVRRPSDHLRGTRELPV